MRKYSTTYEKKEKNSNLIREMRYNKFIIIILIRNIF